jgi:hypothetical protein
MKNLGCNTSGIDNALLSLAEAEQNMHGHDGKPVKPVASLSQRPLSCIERLMIKLLPDFHVVE